MHPLTIMLKYHLMRYDFVSDEAKCGYFDSLITKWLKDKCESWLTFTGKSTSAFKKHFGLEEKVWCEHISKIGSSWTFCEHCKIDASDWVSCPWCGKARP